MRPPKASAIAPNSKSAALYKNTYHLLSHISEPDIQNTDRTSYSAVCSHQAMRCFSGFVLSEETRTWPRPCVLAGFYHVSVDCLLERTGQKCPPTPKANRPIWAGFLYLHGRFQEYRLSRISMISAKASWAEPETMVAPLSRTTAAQLAGAKPSAATASMERSLASSPAQ